MKTFYFTDDHYTIIGYFLDSKLWYIVTSEGFDITQFLPAEYTNEIEDHIYMLLDEVA